MSPDWISNEAIICVYHAGEREFWWSNRAYASCRKAYNEKLKEMKDRHAFGVHALDQSKRGISNDLLLDRWGDFLNGAQLGKFYNLGNPRVLRGVVKDMESADGIEAQPIRAYLFGYYHLQL